MTAEHPASPQPRLPLIAAMVLACLAEGCTAGPLEEPRSVWTWIDCDWGPDAARNGYSDASVAIRPNLGFEAVLMAADASAGGYARGELEPNLARRLLEALSARDVALYAGWDCDVPFRYIVDADRTLAPAPGTSSVIQCFDIVDPPSEMAPLAQLADEICSFAAENAVRAEFCEPSGGEACVVRDE